MVANSKNDERIINSKATNERKLSSMSSSGDIYGICEIIEFAGITNNNNIYNHELQGYLQQCVESSNFQNTVFVSLNFFQQYLIMKYLSGKYKVLIPFSKSSELQIALKKHINSKEFLYQFKNNRQLLISYIHDCFELKDRQLFWKHCVNIDEDCVVDFYPLYLENLSNIPINLLDDIMISHDVNDLSNKLVVSIVGIAEQKLDNSEKNKRIKSLLFEPNISYYQWKTSIGKDYTNDIVTNYWPYIDEQVMFSCFVLFIVAMTVFLKVACSYYKYTN